MESMVGSGVFARCLTGDKPLKYERTAKKVSLCIAYGHLGGEGEGRKPCRNCMALYEREVKQDKKFPPGMSEQAKRNFSPQQWGKFKELERRL